jgi:hypothetical protein
MADKPATAAMMQQALCLSDKSKRARYLVASVGIPVPGDLFPDQTERAAKLLRASAPGGH